ncbi:MAG: CAP domain-containing protein [Solibacillus sp.]
MKKWRSILLASALLVMPIEAQAAKKFNDVPANHYAVEAIQWAEKEGIVSGDAGKFHPSKEVTEAQFVKMYAEFFAFPLNEASAGQAHWSTVYYDSLLRYGAPLKGYANSKLRSQAITRGEVAQLIAFAHGKPSDVDSAVRYMMESGISTGQNKNASSLLEKYGASNTVTRAQAVAFLYRIDEILGNELNASETTEIEKTTIPNKAANVSEPKEKLQNAQQFQLYEMGGGVKAYVVSEDLASYEIKFATGEDVIGGYVMAFNKTFHGVTIGEVDNGEQVVTNDKVTLHVFVDEFEGNAVKAIYWHYNDAQSAKAMQAMKADQSSQKQVSEERIYIDLANVSRAEVGLAPLKENEFVMKAARAHSTDMYENDYYSHTGLNGSQPWDRMMVAGVGEYSAAAENIAKGYETIFHVHNGWMNSEGHRKNLLNPALEEIGVGVDHLLYTTKFFTGR